MKKPYLKALTILVASLMLVFAGRTLIAAEVGGTIKGVVVSDSGELIGGAGITVTHNEKGISRSTQANDEGEYTLRNLPAGQYSVVVSKVGYGSIRHDDVAVTIGEPVNLQSAMKSGGSMEEVVVVGAVVNRLDMAENTAGMSFNQEVLDLMPVDNGFEEMALMVPGAVENSQFRSGSIGGGSSAENAFFLNGINLTTIEDGIGSLRMPWEAVQQTNVQTSGITADFGGALGGIVNAVSKSGSNDFSFGIEYRIDPESSYQQFDSVRQNTNSDLYFVNNELDEDSFTETNVWFSGPIIKDKAFFYALINPIETKFSSATGGDRSDTAKVIAGTHSSTVEKSDRWFVNLEYFINDSHSIGYTGFNTERKQKTTNVEYFASDNSLGDDLGLSRFQDGGKFSGLTYHGELTNTLSIDLIIGSTEEEVVDTSVSQLPLVENCLSGTCGDFSAHSNASINPQEFVRDQKRLDFNWDLNEDHRLSFGIDKYDITVKVDTRQNGVVVGDPADVDQSAAFGWWSFGTSGLGGDGQTAEAFGVPTGENYIRRRVRIRGTDSEVRSQAIYVQDSWQATDVLTLNLGVRTTDFENTVRGGAVYADLQNNVAPRLAAIWDIGGEGKSKVVASWGRYFQPISARMNITQGSSSIEYFDYYRFDPTALDGQGRPTLLADGSPSRGAAYDVNPADPNSNRLFRQRGIVDPNLIASANLEAMYSDQISLGYETEVWDTMKAGVRVTYNELKRSVEDTDYGPILVQELANRGIVPTTDQSSFYIVANPGSAVEIAYDFDTDGIVDQITLTPDQVQLPKPERKYLSWDFTLGGSYGERINFDASYTWTHSYGNTEGLVRTDNGQGDPGWTVSYDYADLMDGSYGDLPNDHRHAVKLSGTYDIADSWVAGLVFRATSGGPKSIFSSHPTDADTCAPGTNLWSYNPVDDSGCVSQYYGANSHYDADGNLVPRGTNGRLPWVKVINASITYQNKEVLGGRFSIKGTVFNLLGEDKPLFIHEEAGGDYGLTSIYQGQRYLSLVGRFEF